jgi:hypothetical protein
MRVLVASVLLSLAGCYNTVIRSGPPGQMAPVEATTFNFAWGITTAGVYTPECTSGVSKVEVYTPWWNYLLAPVTIGIVSGHITEYTCTPSAQAVAPPRP